MALIINEDCTACDACVEPCPNKAITVGSPIYLIDPAKGTLDVVPGERATHIEPLWVGGRLHFIADREDMAFNLYAWDAATRSARRLTDERAWDVRAADAFGDTIVYEAGGRLKELDTRSGAVREIVVRLAAELPEARPRWRDLGEGVEDAAISPAGKRVLLTARGEVFSVPVKDGAVRNLSRSEDDREYTALWSPKGDRVAWVVQRGDAQSLVVRDQAGLEAPREWPLGPGFHRLSAFAPDGEHIAYQDDALALWVVPAKDGERTRIDVQHRRADQRRVAAELPHGARLLDAGDDVVTPRRRRVVERTDRKSVV